MSPLHMYTVTHLRRFFLFIKKIYCYKSSVTITKFNLNWPTLQLLINVFVHAFTLVASFRIDLNRTKRNITIGSNVQKSRVFRMKCWAKSLRVKDPGFQLNAFHSTYLHYNMTFYHKWAFGSKGRKLLCALWNNEMGDGNIK